MYVLKDTQLCFKDKQLLKVNYVSNSLRNGTTITHTPTTCKQRALCVTFTNQCITIKIM